MPYVDKNASAAAFMIYCTTIKYCAKGNGVAVDYCVNADNYHTEILCGLIVQLVSLPHTPQGLSPIGSNRYCVVGRDPRAPANKNEIN